jgi:condensin complex subunit 2
VPERNAAGAVADLSIHLCFICVLHLANEHGLSIHRVEALDKLRIGGAAAALAAADAGGGGGGGH